MIRVINLVLLSLIFLANIAYAKEWQEAKTRHFKIYYRQSVPEDFVSTVADSAEDSYKEVIGNLGISIAQSWNWLEPVNVYIYEDQEDYIKNGNQAAWSHGAALVSTRTIRTFPSDQGFFDSVLLHELGHIVLHEYVGQNADIPLWFDEGVAMYQEKAKRISANKLVKEAILNGKFIPLTQLSDMRLYSNSDQDTVKLFYAESASIVNFMVSELGKSRFSKLISELKEHNSFNVSLDKTYMHISNVEDLNKKWTSFLKD